MASVSDQLMERAQRVIPGGVNSPVRAFNSVGGTPRFIRRGDGAWLHDADGNRVLDLVASWGPLIRGHGNAEVFQAAVAAMGHGTTFGAPTEAEIELAEVIAGAVPSIEKVRLVSSGTEACMTALRLARGVTGRNIMIKFDGHYHGHADAMLRAAGSGVATMSTQDSPGVPAGAAADTVIATWNDMASVDAALDAHAGNVALIICEPVPANMNLVPPAEGFLQGLRDRATAHGALLVFDEVISGFRLARGGAQQVHGVTPDLTTLGKIVGGGFPLAAFGGRAEVMDHLAPVGPVYQAGTLSGNPVAVAAALALLRTLDDAAYAQLAQTATTIEDVLRDALDAAGVASTVTRHETIVGVLFGDGETPRNRGDVELRDHAAYGRFFHAMLDAGVYLAPSGWEVLFPSLALGDVELEHFAAAAKHAAAAV